LMIRRISSYWRKSRSDLWRWGTRFDGRSSQGRPCHLWLREHF
jgi:hypothetical protein